MIRPCLLLSLALALPAAGQTPQFRAESNVVLVPALVENARQDAVYGLQAKDFVIADEGVEQTVHLDEAAAAEPVSIAVVLQIGRRASREFARMRGLRALLEPLVTGQQARIAVLEFDSATHVVSPFSSNPKALSGALDQLSAGDGGAVTLDAIAGAVKLLAAEPQGRQRVVLLVSETRDHGSRNASVDQVVQLLGNNNVALYCLAFSPSLSQVLDTGRGKTWDEERAGPDLLAPLLMARQAMRRNIPKTVASLTGGEYAVFSSQAAFEGRIGDFSNHLHSRYLLSFQPKDPRPGLHRIAVRTKAGADLKVMARTAYWARGNVSDSQP